MKILISNDDGWTAPGIVALADAVQSFADIKVVAPDKNRSAASSSLTLMQPLRAIQQKDDWYSVDGTPADCVLLAFNGLLDWSPDMVISGINAGPNLGDDAVYSGTVAAAMEGYFHGIPGFAFSLTDLRGGYEIAAQIAVDIIKRSIKSSGANPADKPGLLNVNMPNVASAKGVKITATRLGRRGRSIGNFTHKDPRGQKIYWLGAVSDPEDDVDGTDFHAVANNEVSVTPLSYDMTDHDQIATVTKTIAGDAV